MHAAVFGDGSFDGFLHCVFVGYVHGKAERLARRGCGDLGCRRFRSCLVQIGDYHPGALRGKALGNVTADSRAAPVTMATLPCKRIFLPADAKALPAAGLIGLRTQQRVY